MEAELKPCPFCGGKAKLADNTRPDLCTAPHAWVFCTNRACPGSGNEQDTAAEAIAAWNDRPSPDRASIRAEAFEEAAIPVNVLLQWIDEAWPDSGSGSDFNQGVQRGFEIIKAQLENGHIQAYAHAALATKEPSDGRP